ncbi:MAG: hypothetical protein HYV07_03805 [Deltaproteobacteria bacterium]|nr:hypothetical protein [Deltaproteobacteria bacterium]
MSVRSVPVSVQQFESAHRASGAMTNSIRGEASQFFDKLEKGGLSEPLLRLKLAFSSTSRSEISQLTAIVFQPKGAGSANLAELQRWMARNPSLMKAMSTESRQVLERLATRQGEAQALDDEIQRAEAALKKALNPTEQSMSSLAREAQSAGAVADIYQSGIRKISQRLSATLIPGAKQALTDLGGILGNRELSNVERRDQVQAWRQQHPRVDSMLIHSERGYADLGWLLTDLNRVGDWSDGQYQKARSAVMGAFDKAQGA